MCEGSRYLVYLILCSLHCCRPFLLMRLHPGIANNLGSIKALLVAHMPVHSLLAFVTSIVGTELNPVGECNSPFAETGISAGGYKRSSAAVPLQVYALHAP